MRGAIDRHGGGSSARVQSCFVFHLRQCLSFASPPFSQLRQRLMSVNSKSMSGLQLHRVFDWMQRELRLRCQQSWRRVDVFLTVAHCSLIVTHATDVVTGESLTGGSVVEIRGGGDPLRMWLYAVRIHSRFSICSFVYTTDSWGLENCLPGHRAALLQCWGERTEGRKGGSLTFWIRKSMTRG